MFLFVWWFLYGRTLTCIIDAIWQVNLASRKSAKCFLGLHLDVKCPLLHLQKGFFHPTRTTPSLFSSFYFIKQRLFLVKIQFLRRGLPLFLVLIEAQYVGILASRTKYPNSTVSTNLCPQAGKVFIKCINII